MNLRRFEFEKIFHLPRPVSRSSSLWYADIPIEEQVLQMANVRDHLRENLAQVGGHRRDNWNDQWAGKLSDFKKTRNPLDLLPDYLRTNKTMRYDGRYITPGIDRFEYRIASAFRKSLFAEFFKDVDEVHEFGCGGGLNLLDFKGVFPDKKVYGYDWSDAAVEAVNLLFGEGSGRKFDMFRHPTNGFNKTPNRIGFLTFHSMEQLGEKWGNFFSYIWWRGAPSVVVHVEPILELYDESDPIDSLAIRYHKRRGYLSGYFTRLSELECSESRSVSIDAAVRVKFGGAYHDPYSYIVWRPA